MIKLLLSVCLLFTVNAQQYGGQQQGGGFGVQQQQPQNCPSWGRWEESQCFWPTMSFDNIPKTCLQEPSMQGAPDFLTNYKDEKMKQMYEQMQSKFRERGNPPPCGYCSRKMRCRVRQYRPGMEIDEEKCESKEKEHTQDECPGSQVCSMTVEDGGCPNPMDLLKDKKMGKHGKRGPGMGGPPNPEMMQRKMEEMLKRMNDSRGPAEHWNCIKNRQGNRCLCCCGHYFPDPQTEQCRSAKEFFQKNMQNEMQKLQMEMRQVMMRSNQQGMNGGGFSNQDQYGQDPYSQGKYNQQQGFGMNDPYASNNMQGGFNQQQPFSNDPYSPSYQQQPNNNNFNGGSMSSFGMSGNGLGGMDMNTDMDTQANSRYPVSAYSLYPQRKDMSKSLSVPFLPQRIQKQLKVQGNGK